MPDGSIVLTGGRSEFTNKNDTWQSKDNGATWVLINASSGWPVRSGHSSVVMPDSRILLIGGKGDSISGDKNLNDVWMSTDNGATWSLVNASALTSGRHSHSCAVMPNGHLILTGGIDDDYHYNNDVWMSADSGATWTEVNVNPGWPGRESHSSVVLPDSSIVLMGGIPAGNNLNDVWRLQPAGSLEPNPSHTYIEPGNYTVTLQVYNTNGYNSTQKTEYIHALRNTKIGIYKNGAWQLDRNGNIAWDDTVTDRQYSWGWSASSPLVGDWNGDGKTEVGTYYSGQWWLDYNGNGAWDGPSVDKYYTFGSSGSIPLVGDWNGDGKTETGTYTAGIWKLDYDGNGVWDSATDKQYTWGWSASTPLVGDWNGDRKTEIGVYYNGNWWLDYNGDGVWDSATDKHYTWGWSASSPLIGDWNADGKSKIAVYYNGQWWLDYNGNGLWDSPTDKQYGWGWSASSPVVGDWNGDGKTEIGVHYNGNWWLDANGNGLWDGQTVDKAGSFGTPDGIPVIGKW
jgi:hypothetical protein